MWESYSMICRCGYHSFSVDSCCPTSLVYITATVENIRCEQPKDKRKAWAAVLTIQCSTGTGFRVMWPAWWGAPLVLAHPASHHEKSLDLQGGNARSLPESSIFFLSAWHFCTEALANGDYIFTVHLLHNKEFQCQSDVCWKNLSLDLRKLIMLKGHICIFAE